MNDTQLLQSFAEQNSEAAFRSLVERHLPLVFGTARRMTGDNALAEDAAQTVFILLSRKANRISRDTILSGWLYRTTRFVTSRALTAELRRRRREQEAVTMQSSPTSEPSWLRFGPQLDDALARLGDTDRNAILLRYFEQQSLREVGLSLGLSEEAAQKRVIRALEKLRRALGRRGAEISAVALAAGLTKEAADAASVLPLAGKISSMVLAQGAAGAGAAAGSALLTNVLAAWRWAKILNIAAAVGALIVAALILPPAARYWQKQAGSSGSVKNSSTSMAPAQSRIPSNIFASRSGTNAGLSHTLAVTVLDAKTGQPVAGAILSPYVNGVIVPAFNEQFHTGADGAVTLHIPDNIPDGDRGNYCEIPVNAPGYVTRIMRWYSTTGMVTKFVKGQHIVRLDHGVNLSGVIVDDAGKPLPGIRVGATGNNCNGSVGLGNEEDYSTYNLAVEMSPVLTDARGAFTLEHYPADVRALELDLLAPDQSLHKFQTPEGVTIHAETLPRVSLTDLKNGVARLVIPQGVNVHGIVVNNQGTPIAGAKVVEATQWGNLRVLSRNRTDSSGQFCLSNRPQHEILLGVSAESNASLSTIISIQPGMDVVRLVLSPEFPLRGQIVNEAGLPVPSAEVAFVDYVNPGQCQFWTDETGADGRFEWTDAPTNEVALTVFASGYAPHMARLRASTNEALVTLRLGKINGVHITGQITDADSGAPLDHFDVTVKHSMNTLNFEGTNGTMDIKLARKDFPLGVEETWSMTVEADGYDAAVSREYQIEEGDQQLDFKLKRGGVMEGVLRTPAGAVAADAQLNFTVAGHGPMPSLEPGNLSVFVLPIEHSDDDGHFKLKKPPGAKMLTVFHDTGWAAVPITSGNQTGDINLSPWGRIEGTVTIGDKPVPDRQVRVEYLTQDMDGAFVVFYRTNTDNNGRFVFDKMPAGDFKLVCGAGRWNVATLQATVTIGAGETKSVEMTSVGRAVAAQLEAPPGFGAINWSNAQVILTTDVSIPPEPVRNDFISEERLKAAHSRYIHDPSVLAALGRQRTFAGSAGADGIATFEQVPTGNYILEVKLFDPTQLPPPPNLNNDPAVVIAHLRASVVVPENNGASDNDTPAALGDFALDAP